VNPCVLTSSTLRGWRTPWAWIRSGWSKGLLGIPGVHVLNSERADAGLRIELETAATEARCPICDSPAAPAGRRLVDLGVQSAMGQPMDLRWQRRVWRCPAPGCGGSFVEQSEEIAAFLGRSPHRGGEPL